jgi:hypothetical protein
MIKVCQLGVDISVRIMQSQSQWPLFPFDLICDHPMIRLDATTADRQIASNPHRLDSLDFRRACNSPIYLGLLFNV